MSVVINETYKRYKNEDENLMRHNKKKIGFILFVGIMLNVISGCSSQRETWKMVYDASPEAVDAAIQSDATFPYTLDAGRNSVPGIDPPIHLRPCCAFGMDLKTSLYSIPIPFVRVKNIVDPDELGLHTYDAGLVGHGTDQDERESSEENGVVYTCRGGFIDVAHVRDYSDWTMYLAFWIYSNFGDDLELDLPAELGPRKVIFKNFDIEGLDREQQLILAVTMAQYAAYQLSLWHELAQWHGFGMQAFPEYPSSYSVEDLYSNILGTKIAMAIMYSGGAKTDQVYSRFFDQWLGSVLDHLQVQSVEGSRAYMKAIDQHWWDSNTRLPGKFVVLKRNYDMGNVQQPAIPSAELRSGVEAEYKQACENTEPVSLTVIDEVYGIRMEDLITLKITIDDEFAESFTYPTPEHAKSRVITDRDFSAIAKISKAADKKTLEEMGKWDDVQQ